MTTTEAHKAYEDWLEEIESSHGVSKNNIADVCRMAFFAGYRAGLNYDPAREAHP